MTEQVEALLAEQDEAIERMRLSGVQAAKNDAAYRCALACEMARMEARGARATVMERLAQGVPAVAEARLARGMAEAMYAADREVVQNNKRRIDVAREQEAREWARAGQEPG